MNGGKLGSRSAAISQELELLANLWLYVSVFGIEPAQSILKCINVFNLKLLLSYGINAFHYLDEPTSRFLPLIPQKESFCPL